MIKKLKEVMPIDRAKMKLRITTDDDAAPLREALGGLGVTNFEAVGGGGGGSGEVLDFLVDPGIYRDVEEAVRTVAGCVPRVVSRREMRVSAANFCFSVSLPVSSRKRKQLGLVSWKRREGLTVFGHNFRGAAKEPCGACCRQAFSSCLCALHRVCVAVLTCVLCSLPPPTQPLRKNPRPTFAYACSLQQRPVRAGGLAALGATGGRSGHGRGAAQEGDARGEA